MFNVGVYVTSRYKDYEEFKVTLDEALSKYLPTGKPNALVTGSSKSNTAGNGLVRRYAFEKGIPCRVFETQWANNIPTKPGKKNTAGVRANAMIIKNSNACVLFWTPTSIAKWDFMSGGCYNFRKMCGKLQRELIPIKVDIYKPLSKPSDDEEIRTSPNEEPIGDIGLGMRASDLMGGHVGGVDTSIPSSSSPSLGISPTGGSHAPTQAVGGSGDVGGDIGMEEPIGDIGSSPIAPSSIGGGSTAAGKIVDVPVDVNGDGTPDTSITAMDTTGDGVPDSQLTPVDVDGNGTIDKIDLEPLPTTPQPQNTPQTTQNTSQNNQSVTTANTQAAATDDENSNSQPNA